MLALRVVRRLLPMLMLAAALPGAAAVVAACSTPAAADPPPVSGPCGGIRPGALMTSPAGCTMNFVFTSNETDRYIGTAAHCVGSVGQSVSLSGEGVIGTVAFTGWAQVPHHDFALVKVNSSKLSRVNPAMCHWGGPTMLAEGYQDEPVLLQHYGHGIGAGSVNQSKARRGIGTAWNDYSFFMATAGTFGDSGSPVMSIDGKALGVLVTIGAFGNTSTRLDVALADASTKMGIPLKLVTAPLA